MQIPVNTDRVQRRGIDYTPISGYSAEAMGSRNARGMADVGRAVTGLGAAMVQNSYEMDNARAVKAQNNTELRLAQLRTDIKTKMQFENAEKADEYYNVESGKIISEEKKNAGVKYRATEERFNPTFDRLKNAGQVDIDVYKKGQQQAFIKMQQAVNDDIAIGAAIDSKTPEGFMAFVDSRVKESAEQYGPTQGKTFVVADSKERITRGAVAYWQATITKDPKLAQQALEYAKPFMSSTIYSQLGGKTDQVLEAKEMESLTASIYQQSGGSIEKAIELVGQSDYKDKPALMNSITKMYSKNEELSNKVFNERMGNLFTAVVNGEIKSYEQVKAILPLMNLSGDDYVKMDKKARDFFGIDDSGQPKVNNLQTIERFETKLSNGTLKSGEVMGATDLKNSTKEAYIKAIPSAYKLSEAQQNYVDTGKAIIRNAGLSPDDAAAANTLLIKGAKDFRNEEDAVKQANSILNNKLYDSKNFLPSIENQAAVRAAYENTYGAGNVQAVSDIAKGFAVGGQDWSTEKRWQATTSILDKTRKTTNSNVPQSDYQALLQVFVQQMSNSSSPVVFATEKEFMDSWERFLIKVGDRKGVAGLFVPLPPEKKATTPVPTFAVKDYSHPEQGVGS